MALPPHKDDMLVTMLPLYMVWVFLNVGPTWTHKVAVQTIESN